MQFREGQTADDVRALWDTIERLWAQAIERAGRLPAAAVDQQVNEEWSFAQTLRHLVFITDAWASRTVLDEEMPCHPLGLPQSWYPAADAAALGIDLTVQPNWESCSSAPSGVIMTAGWPRPGLPAVARPVRLRGTVADLDSVAGEVLDGLNTEDLPDRAIYGRCGGRRVT